MAHFGYMLPSLDCGAPLAAGLDAAAPAQAPTAGKTAAAIRVTTEPAAGEILEGERKTVTALFADIKGSTEIEHTLRALDRGAADQQQQLQRLDKSLTDYQAQAHRPFEHEARLKELLAR